MVQFPFGELPPFLGGGAGKSAINEELDDLPDEQFIIFGKAVVAADVFAFKTLENVCVVGPAPMFGDGVIMFGAGGGIKCGLVLVQEYVEVACMTWRFSDESAGRSTSQ